MSKKINRNKCILCGVGTGDPGQEYYKIHPECFLKWSSIINRMETVEEYAKGELPRIGKAGNRIGHEAVEEFLSDMKDFDRRSRNILKLARSESTGKPMEKLEKKEKT